MLVLIILYFRILGVLCAIPTSRGPCGFMALQSNMALPNKCQSAIRKGMVKLLNDIQSDYSGIDDINID